MEVPGVIPGTSQALACRHLLDKAHHQRSGCRSSPLGSVSHCVVHLLRWLLQKALENSRGATLAAFLTGRGLAISAENV